jgi:hypothetical protein
MVAQTSIKAALKYLRRHLMGYHPGSPQYEYHADKVRCSGRPMATAKRIYRERSAAKATASNSSDSLDPSDVQELYAKCCRRQGGISSEQAKIFRHLDAQALRGLLTRGDLKAAEKIIRLLKPTQDKAWFQDEREAEVHRSGCKRQPHLREVAT